MDQSFKWEIFHFETTASSNVPLVNMTQECIVLLETQLRQQLLLSYLENNVPYHNHISFEWKYIPLLSSLSEPNVIMTVTTLTYVV